MCESDLSRPSCCDVVFSTATTKHLVYFSLDYRGEVQELTFDQQQVHRLFYGSFHKVFPPATLSSACALQ